MLQLLSILLRHRAVHVLLALAIPLFSAWAQPGSGISQKEAHPKAQADYEAGVRASFEGDDRRAIRYLESAVKREPNFIDALIELAGIAYNSKGYAKAESLLSRVVAMGGDGGEKALYGLAMAQLKQEKYGQAAQHLSAYLKREELRDERRAAAERFLRQATFREQALRTPVDFALERLSDAVNTEADAEYLPSLSADGNTLVFTRRLGGRNEDFFVSTRDSSGNWQAAQPIDAINTSMDEGAQTISSDGSLIVFTGCNRDDGYGSCDLYFSQLRDGAWTSPENLGAPVNSRAWESQPSLSANGNLLFFSARRKDGYGGADLYACGRAPGGGWTAPINLGPTVNTDKDDQAPFYHSDGKTLYFMSEGHPGMGGFDLFVTRLQADNTWSTPENLGYPINTESNEGALVVGLDGRTAYYATDAAAQGTDSIGVGGARSGLTDLYRFTLPEAVAAGRVTYVRATVIDAVTEAPVAAAALFADAATDKPFVKRRASKQDGTFLAVLPSGKTYTLAVEEPGYLFYSDRFVLTEPADAEQPYELEIRLQPIQTDVATTNPEVPAEGEPVVLRNVLFETGLATLLPASQNELDRLSSLLEGNTSMKIRIQGHTDDVGDPADNQLLSQRRAEAVKTYLVAEGIAEDRLSSAGFGESRPLVPNVDEASRALNRRTEFVVQ